MNNNIHIDIRESRDPVLAITAGLMLSDDYKERFVAEYLQTKFRCEEMRNMLYFNKWKIKGIPELYAMQIRCMEEYLNILKIRAQSESINIPDKITISENE